jgi:hypothetical protein
MGQNHERTPRDTADLEVRATVSSDTIIFNGLLGIKVSPRTVGAGLLPENRASQILKSSCKVLHFYFLKYAKVNGIVIPLNPPVEFCVGLMR